jgi:LysM repeat protein
MSGRTLSARRLTRASLVAAVGAAVALPLVGAGSASAASVSTWDKVAQCESGGDWTINTGNGFFGGLQFSQSTWDAYGGSKYAATADKATKDQQITVAEKVLAAQGPGAWPNCGPKAGLTQNSGDPQVDPSGKEEQAAKPAADKPAQKPAAKPAEKPAQQAEGTYTVVHGDTLAKISRDKHIEGGWQKLYAANKNVVGGNPDLILPGQKLSLATATNAVKDAPAPSPAPANAASTHAYGDNLDGWIREALDIMKAHNIPGSYDGIKRNIMRESGGDPNAQNNWDINAQNGTPSIGLLQVIQPTFDAYHVEGTANDLHDPVANIVAACNYAADKYGSMDNVDSAY